MDTDTAYFEHASSDQPIVCEEMDTMVLALGHAPEDALEAELEDYPGEVIAIGDCFSPRTAEEAVLDGVEDRLTTIKAQGTASMSSNVITDDFMPMMTAWARWQDSRGKAAKESLSLIRRIFRIKQPDHRRPRHPGFASWV